MDMHLVSDLAQHTPMMQQPHCHHAAIQHWSGSDWVELELPPVEEVCSIAMVVRN